MTPTNAFSYLIVLVLLVLVPLIWMIISPIMHSKDSPNLVKPEMIFGLLTNIIGGFIISFYTIFISKYKFVAAFGLLYSISIITTLVMYLLAKKQETKDKLEVGIRVFTGLNAAASMAVGVYILFYYIPRSAPAPAPAPAPIVMNPLRPVANNQQVPADPPQVFARVNNPNGSVQVGAAPAPPPTRGNALLRQANQA